MQNTAVICGCYYNYKVMYTFLNSYNFHFLCFLYVKSTLSFVSIYDKCVKLIIKYVYGRWS